MTTYFLSFGAGALTALSPCILPVLPIMAGSAVSEKKTGPLYIAAGLTTSLVTMGLLFSSAVSIIGLSEEKVRTLSAVLLLLSGLTIAIPIWKSKLNSNFQFLSDFAFKLSDKLNFGSRAGKFGIVFYWERHGVHA